MYNFEGLMLQFLYLITVYQIWKAILEFEFFTACIFFELDTLN